MTFKYDFSIIIPVYNRAKYLNKCIESVLQQDYDLNKIQMILIDDGSLDRSLSICQKFAKKNKNIIVIHQQNQGVSVARNQGLDKADGKFILFLDSDDYLSKNVCKTIYSFFNQHQNEVDLVTYPILYHDGKKITKHFRYSKLYTKGSGVYDLEEHPELIQSTINFCIKNQGQRTKKFNTEISFSEDEDYATAILMEKQKIGFCEECIYYYRRHLENTNANYKMDETIFKSVMLFYKSKFETYGSIPYLQHLFLNTLRWRLNEYKLFPNNQIDRKNCEKDLRNILDYIEKEIILNNKDIPNLYKLYLLHLKGISLHYKFLEDKILVVDQKNNDVLLSLHQVETIINYTKRNLGQYNYTLILLFPNNEFILTIKNKNKEIKTNCIYEKRDLYNSCFKLQNYSFKSKKDAVLYLECKNSKYKYPIVLNKKMQKYLILKNPFATGVTIKENRLIIKHQNRLRKCLKRVKNGVKKVIRFGLRITKKILQKLRRSSYILLYKYYCKKVPLDKNKVLFLSASRATLTGNFEFVYRELKEHYHYEINSVLKKSLNSKNSLQEQFHLMKLIASSKYILLDDFYPMIYTLKLRKGTELIQLWHAMGAFKTVGYSRMGKVGGPSVKSLTHKNYTATIVSSENIRKNYAEAFDISIDKVHALGVPRTDIFFDKNYKKNITKKLHEKYPFIKDKKVILFAPTFRGNGQKSAHYNFEWLDFGKIKEQLQDQYVFLIKLHPFITARPDIVDHEFYFDLSDEREINDLLFITDVLITDYSSVIFEYSFFKKPVVFFIPDYKEYVASRDFYYDFDKYMYGSTATTTDELIQEIKKGKVNKKKIDAFIKYFCSACDGKSTERVVKDLIVNKK